MICILVLGGHSAWVSEKNENLMARFFFNWCDCTAGL